MALPVVRSLHRMSEEIGDPARPQARAAFDALEQQLVAAFAEVAR